MSSEHQESESTELGKRPVSFLARISQAIKEQNWFAVVLEMVIVILGVVIGFQITAWGEDRAQRTKERAYLVQLANDLRQTEGQILVDGKDQTRADGANSKLVRAFFQPVPPPLDSIVVWFSDAQWYRPLTPVTATAEALIASGDLSLIQNDTLRSEITAWVPWVKNRAVATDRDIGKWWDQRVQLADRYDPSDFLIIGSDAALIDSLARSDRHFTLPSGDRIRKFPVSINDFLNDRFAYNALRGMLEFKEGMEYDRELVLDSTRVLLRMVEAELDN